MNADQMRWAHLALEEFGAPLAGEASHIEDVGYVRVLLCQPLAASLEVSSGHEHGNRRKHADGASGHQGLDGWGREKYNPIFDT